MGDQINLSVSYDELPTWNQLIKFMESRFKTLEMLEPTEIIYRQSLHSTMQDERKSNYNKCLLCFD